MWVSDKWEDYRLLDAADGYRLERWGTHVLVRPDPQVIWKTARRHSRWNTPDAKYTRSSDGGGSWTKHKLPEHWTVGYGGLSFQVKPMNFKHTGLFPEQAVNWDAMRQLIEKRARREKPFKVLNLFAYTGAATMACAAAGAQVTHVDAAKGMVAWARENAALSKLEARWIIDDCAAFVAREFRRGNRYDGIVLDPPSYGRGPSGEVWKLEENLFPLLEQVVSLLSDDAQFLFLNSYTTGLAPGVLAVMLDLLVKPRFGGRVEAGELGLPVDATGVILPCGATGRWIQS